MTHFARNIKENDYRLSGVQPHGRFWLIEFLKRYPIFILLFGPPIFRSAAGIDATQGAVDIWAIFQVGLLGMVAFRAIRRLTTAESIFIPKQIRSILKYAFFLSLLFLISAAYSPSPITSACYSVLDFLTWICIAEFVVDIYMHPPNWMQCLFAVRIIAFLLFVLAIVTVFFNPQLVMVIILGAGIRLGGGTVGFIPVICPVIAIVSAYAFLYSLEPKGRSIGFFLAGLGGTLLTQSRASELALLLAFAILVFGWAKTSKRSAYLVILGVMVFMLLSSVVLGSGGGGRIWNTFNRGENAEGIESASGRTDIWKYVIQYCITHPQGMGYITGFRVLFREYSSLGIQVEVSHIGNPHNSFLEVLADAGWLAFVAYLIMMTKVVAVGFGFVKKRCMGILETDSTTRHAIRCGLLLLVFCFGMGMSIADFCIPLRQTFYFQNIIIAIILGASSNMLVASRGQHTVLNDGCPSDKATTLW